MPRRHVQAVTRVPRVLRPEYAPARLQPHLIRYLVFVVAIGSEVGLVAFEALVDGLEVVAVVHELLGGREVPLAGEDRLLGEARVQPVLQRLEHVLVRQLGAVRVPVLWQPVVPRVLVEEDLGESGVLGDEAGGRAGVGEGVAERAGRLVEVVLVHRLVHREGPLVQRQVRYRRHVRRLGPYLG